MNVGYKFDSYKGEAEGYWFYKRDKQVQSFNWDNKGNGNDVNTIEEIRKGLFEVINNESGTGKRAKAEGVIAAGKTGTAQNSQGRTHAWFTGFAPFENPKICVTVFLEHGGKGGLEPAEIARGIFEEARKKGYL